MEYNYKIIGEIIRNKRKELGYNQDEFLAILKKEEFVVSSSKDSIHLSRNTLSKIENGDLPPERFSISLLIAMCKIFNCDIGHLLGEYTEKTKKEKIIQDELHLSEKAICNLKEIMFNSIKAPYKSELSKLLAEDMIYDDGIQIIDTIPSNETYIYSLNLILEEYPELIEYIGKIMLHRELNLYTSHTTRGRYILNKTYDIDIPLLNLIIKIKHYVENKKKLSTRIINNNNMRYDYAIQFITKHMKELEKNNAYLIHCLDEMHSDCDDNFPYE